MNKIGKYEVLEKIGTGGFGVVYKAYDPFIKRLVAVKTCTADDEDIRQRFFQEAEIAGNLQHRNVVTVYDFGVQGEVPYLIQEYLTGEDLDRKIKRREAMPHRERLLFLVQIARGLEYAHSKGVIHRDIKPANIRILEDGTAKIMDFGIAKLAQRQSGLTQTGMTLGTAAYLAPEQIRGEPVDQRTDIFSLGVLAYELLTFERPFSGEVISTVLYQILNARPRPIAETWPDSPSDFVAVVEKCLQKDPAKRYPTCGDLLRDLDLVLRRMRASAARPLADTGAVEAAAPTSAISTTRSGALSVSSSAPTAAALASPLAHEPTQVRRAEPELDLAFDRYRRTPRSISTSAAYREKNVSKASWIAAILGVVVVVGAGVWYWQGRPAAVPVSSPPAASASLAAAPPAAAGPASSAPATTSPANPGATAPPPVAPTPAPVPAPPKPPANATLALPAAFDPETTLTIDRGPARRLDRAQQIEVPPGKHLLIFELLSDGGSVRRDVTVDLRAGSTVRQEIPIVQPGYVTVQAALSTPMGLVTVDGGESWGTSPATHMPLQPGAHQITIRAANAQSAGSRVFVVPVTVRSGSGVTVTFNLLKDDPPLVYESAAN